MPDPVAKDPAVDLSNGIAVRTYLESLRAQQNTVASSWVSQWSQLRDFFQPRGSVIGPEDVNNGARRDQFIINETGLLALRILKSGMLTGMSNQTREWFKLSVDDEALMESQDVKTWCEDAADCVRRTMLKSNYYQTLLEHYGNEGLYGTSAFLIEEDDQTDIRCKPYTNGSYTVGLDDTLRVDLSILSFMMTARQILEKFGYDNCSSAVQTYKASNAGGIQETYLQVAHVICRGTYFDQRNVDPKIKAALGGDIPWLSIWYEVGQYNEKKGLLRQSLFYENPLMCGRWNVTGENCYGESPAMDVLGSVMSLQTWEERLAQGAEKQFNPVTIAGTDVDPRRVTSLPGETIFVDAKDVSKAFGAAYNVDFKLDQGINMVHRIEDRIREGMFVNVFQQFIDSDRRQQTAEEVRAKMQEKMQVLGPVVERNVEEVLAPSVMRILGILGRKGKLPPLPDAVKKSGARIKPQFESMLASAQKMLRLNNVGQVLQMVGQEAALNAGILDNFDFDKIAQGIADDASLPAEFVRTPEAVAALRAAKQRQQQQQDLLNNAKNLAQAAQVASQTPTGAGTNLLGKVAPQVAGGAPS